MAITPSEGSPATIKPMLMAQSGSPWTRFPVPSIGSIDQRRGPRASGCLVLFAGERIVGKPGSQSLADHFFQVVSRSVT